MTSMICWLSSPSGGQTILLFWKKETVDQMIYLSEMSQHHNRSVIIVSVDLYIWKVF